MYPQQRRQVLHQSEFSNKILTNQNTVFSNNWYLDQTYFRRTQPEAFRYGAGEHIDYIENQCSKPLPDCSYTVGSRDVRKYFNQCETNLPTIFSLLQVTVIANDDILYSRTVQDCERFCDDVRNYSNQNYLSKREIIPGSSFQLPQLCSERWSLLPQWRRQSHSTRLCSTWRIRSNLQRESVHEK